MTGIDDAALVRAITERVLAAGVGLRAMDPVRRVELLVAAGARLADPNDPLGAEAVALLPTTTGHSREMVEWALRTSCARDATGGLAELLARWQPAGAERLVAQPARLAAVVLAGNVFTAAFRALALPLAAGVPVVAKAPSRDDVFPRLLARAVAEVDATLGAAVDVVTFAGGLATLEDALFERCDAVLAYGSDHTLADLRSRLPGHVHFAPHGHGLGAAYVTTTALETAERVRDAARALALDVAAYDQRGCLSPQVVLVTRFGRTTPRELASLLAAELGMLARTLPRGPLPVEIGAQQMQWRGVAASRSDVVDGESTTFFEGDGFAVSYERDAGLRMGPGHRNVLVLDAGDARDALSRLAPLGVHLKCLGVAGSSAERETIARALTAPLAPRVCAAGTMQRPPLDLPWDARDPLEGLQRFVAQE